MDDAGTQRNDVFIYIYYNYYFAGLEYYRENHYSTGKFCNANYGSGSIKIASHRVPGLHRLNRLGMNRMKRILGIEKNEENRKGCPPRQPRQQMSEVT